MPKLNTGAAGLAPRPFQHLRADLRLCAGDAPEDYASILPFLFRTQELSLFELMSMTSRMSTEEITKTCADTLIPGNRRVLDMLLLLKAADRLRQAHYDTDPLSPEAATLYHAAQDLKRQLTHWWTLLADERAAQALRLQHAPQPGSGKKIRVCVVSTTDTNGGAAIAAFRLHQSFNKLDTAASTMLVLEKSSDDPTVVALAPPRRDIQHDSIGDIVADGSFRTMADGDATAYALQIALQWVRAATDRIVHTNLPLRSAVSNTLFSAVDTGFDISSHEAIVNADVINIHWSSFFLSAYSLERVLALGKPVFLTLHDMRHFTGGCHYAAGCEEFQKNCFPCPQVSTGIAKLVVHDQFEALRHSLANHSNLFLTAPSEWLATLATSSSLFRHHTAYAIPNSVSGSFSANSAARARARAALEIPRDAKAVLFIANGLSEKRKGADVFLPALREYARRLRATNDAVSTLTVVTIGNENEAFIPAEFDAIQIINLGYVSDEKRIADIYAAVDFLVLPTLEDNYPNVIIESLAVGTPVITFNRGGCGEVVNEANGTGYLISPSEQSLTDMLVALTKNALAVSPQRCTDYIAQHNTPQKQANAYLAAFGEALRATAPRQLAAARLDPSWLANMSLCSHPPVTVAAARGVDMRGVRTVHFTRDLEVKRLRLGDSESVRVVLDQAQAGRDGKVFLKTVLPQNKPFKYLISYGQFNREISSEDTAAASGCMFDCATPHGTATELTIRAVHDLGYGVVGHVIFDLGYSSHLSS